MSNRQLMVLIISITALSLALAWTIERTQVRKFVMEFDHWWEAKNGGGNTPDTSGT